MAHNVVIPTIYGPQILNRHAKEFEPAAKTGAPYDNQHIEMYAAIIACTGQNPFIVDIGGCFGDFTLGFARLLANFNPQILTFEPQLWLYHCICGTVALNDLENVQVINAAVGAFDGHATVPRLDYTRAGSFGSLGMVESPSEQRFGYIEQEIDPSVCRKVDMMAIDSLQLRPSAMKIDCEGMEIDVLRGASVTIAHHRPVIFAEHIKSDVEELIGWFKDHNYETNFNDGDVICFPVEKRGMFPEVVYG